MPWWGWMAVGVGLLVLEVMIQTEFWLAMLGLAGLSVGVIGLVAQSADTGLPVWGQWAALAVLAVFFTVVVRRKIHEKFVGSAPGLTPELVGEYGIARVRILPAETGEVELRGSLWKARNVGTSPIDAGTRARVEHVEGVNLDVRG